MAWIRTLPCIACGVEGRSEAAHTGTDGGMSMKASDYSCVPLCSDCHTQAPGAYHRVGKRVFERAARAFVRGHRGAAQSGVEGQVWVASHAKNRASYWNGSGRVHLDFREFRVERVDEPVRLRWHQRRGKHQDSALTFRGKGIPNRGKTRRSGNLPPVGRQFRAGSGPRGKHCPGYRRPPPPGPSGIVRIDVDKVLDHGQGKMFRGVGDARARTRPASPK